MTHGVKLARASAHCRAARNNMSLKSLAFRGDARMEKAAASAPPLARGESSHAVALLQAALITRKYKLPKSSTKKHGAPDGIFGDETVSAVRAFQTDQKLVVDGVAGKSTIGRLDSLLPPAPPAPPLKLPKPTPAAPPPAPSPPGLKMPVSADFKIGTGDPTITPDSGAGPWGSKSKEVLTAAKYVGIVEILGIAYVAIGDDAVKHMSHYLGNSGTPLTIDLEGMIAEVPSAKLLFDLQITKIKSYVEQLPPGTWDVTSTHAVNGYNTAAESKNWYFAVGGYSVWAKGKATILGAAPGHVCTLALEYRFYDRYNWDKGKSVTIAGIKVSDDAMGEFHREGMAKEYDEVGVVRRTLNWKAP
jgi:peptidoglycan hydrolase-like protein with peptidoglycan-binding domain